MKPSSTSARVIHGAEKRQSPRYEADHDIVVKCRNRTLSGRCVDYSNGGFGAVIERDLPVGEIICVEIPALGHEPTRLLARAVYRRRNRYGFEFIAPESGKRQTIADFFREALERAGGSDALKHALEAGSFYSVLSIDIDRHLKSMTDR